MDGSPGSEQPGITASDLLARSLVRAPSSSTLTAGALTQWLLANQFAVSVGRKLRPTPLALEVTEGWPTRSALNR